MKSKSNYTQLLLVCIGIIALSLWTYHIYTWRLLTPYSWEWYLDTNTDDPYIISWNQVIVLNTISSASYPLKIDSTARILSWADPSTFQVIPYERVARDDDQVRYRWQEVTNIHVSSFKLVYHYLCDDSWRWYRENYLTGAGWCNLLDPDAYQIASNHPKVLRSKNHKNDPKYLILPIGIRNGVKKCQDCDIDTRTDLQGEYSKDMNNYYYLLDKIPLQNTWWFRFINVSYWYSTDGFNIYYQSSIVSWADAWSFKSTPSWRMQDKNWRYCDWVFVWTQQPVESTINSSPSRTCSVWDD